MNYASEKNQLNAFIPCVTDKLSKFKKALLRQVNQSGKTFIQVHVYGYLSYYA